MFTALICKRDYILLVIVGEFSLLCCTSMAHAGNTKIRAKIISAYGKKCSISGFSSLREGRRAKTQVYDFPGHESITQRSDDGKALKYYAQYPGGLCKDPRRENVQFMGPARPYVSRIGHRIGGLPHLERLIGKI